MKRIVFPVLVFSGMFAGLVLVAHGSAAEPVIADMVEFRGDTCRNAQGEEGLNPYFLGPCGKLDKAELGWIQIYGLNLWGSSWNDANARLLDRDLGTRLPKKLAADPGERTELNIDPLNREDIREGEGGSPHKKVLPRFLEQSEHRDLRELVESVRSGDKSRLKKILKSVSVNQRIGKAAQTPLMYAAAECRVGMVRFLIGKRQGADKLLKDRKGNTARKLAEERYREKQDEDCKKVEKLLK